MIVIILFIISFCITIGFYEYTIKLLKDELKTYKKLWNDEIEKYNNE
jgi:hypothetical protein